MAKVWTKEEIKTLISLYGENKSNIEIAEALGRTKSSVSGKLSNMGMSRPIGTNQNFFGLKNHMSGKKHNDETIKKIRENAISRFKDKKNHPAWKGGKRLNHNGYILIRMPEHKRAVNGYVFEHVLVMENILQRELCPGEIVHHINGKRNDNRPKNLMLFRDVSDHNHYHSFFRKKEVFGT